MPPTRELILERFRAQRARGEPVIGGGAGTGISAKLEEQGGIDLIDGDFRKNLEETGISYRQEVECVALARKMGLLTTPYVFDEEQLRWMIEAGADILVLHMGTTSGGSIGASSVRSLDGCVDRCKAMSDLARSIRPEVLVLCHGGAIAEPEDALYVLERVPGLDGF